MSELDALAYGTLFPVTTELDLSDDIRRFLDHGGKAVLFGEYADEYATGHMRPERVAAESAELWQRTCASIRERAGAVLVALDADISAVHRLHHLTPTLPTLMEAQTMDAAQFEIAIAGMAVVAKALGVNLLLSPTADVVVGGNPWLAGRTLGDDIGTVERLVAGYVRGARRAGMACALKHFPGHPSLSGHPAVDDDAIVPGDLGALQPFLRPFAAGIDAGVDAVMMSPANFKATGGQVAGSVSPDLIQLLREDLGFTGVVMTCDLDHKATIKRGDVTEIAVAALTAGADMLLISAAAVPMMNRIARRVADAVEAGQFPPQRLQGAAAAVARLASRTSR